MAKMQIKTYTGTMESLEELVNDCRMQSHQYHFDVSTKALFIRELGILYRPGDAYQVILPETFEVI